jgi:FkbM family methyltransferase
VREGLPREEIRKFVEGADYPWVVEVGANDGGDTLAFLKFMGDLPGFHVHAFEPDPRAAWRFLYNVNGHPQATLYQAAVGSDEGFAELRLSRGVHPNFAWYGEWDKASSLMTPTAEFGKAWPYLNMDQKVQVWQTSLDDWGSEKNVPGAAFLWADVEGATAQLIEGAGWFLTRVDYFYCEYARFRRFEGEPLLDELVAMLADDFDVVEVFEDDVLFKNRGLS